MPDGKYPFMAVLDIGGAAGASYLCGGTLIDPDSVLTAAHCIEGATDVDLAVGRTVLSQNQGQVRSATDWFIPSGYDGSEDDRYDAAVLTLDRPVNGITPIKLATARQDGLERPGRNLTVAGWGTTSENGNTSDRMREVSVPVVSDTRAREAYGSRSYFPNLMVAAGARGQDSCQGDSGGGAVQTARQPHAGRDRELRQRVCQGRLPRDLHRGQQSRGQVVYRQCRPAVAESARPRPSSGRVDNGEPCLGARRFGSPLAAPGRRPSAAHPIA